MRFVDSCSFCGHFAPAQKELGERFVIARARYASRPFAFVILEHVMSDFVQQNLLQREFSERLAGPRNRRRDRSGIRRADASASSFEISVNFLIENARNLPIADGLF